MNSVIMVGRLTADPEVKYKAGENSTASCRFSIAVRRDFKNADGNYDADFPNCVAFRQTAEFVGKYFHKGDMIGIIGRLQTGSYTNKDGVKVYTTEVIVDRAYFIGGKKSDDGSTTTTQKTDDFMNIPQGNEDGLPF